MQTTPNPTPQPGQRVVRAQDNMGHEHWATVTEVIDNPLVGFRQLRVTWHHGRSSVVPADQFKLAVQPKEQS